MRNKFQNSALVFLVFAFLAGALVLVYVAGIHIPRQVENMLGPPDENLDMSRRILYSNRLFLNMESLMSPGGIERRLILAINEGESASKTASEMEVLDVITDSETFTAYLIYKGIDRKIQAGAYRISPQMTAIEIADLIYDETPEDFTFSFLPGWRAEEIAALIPQSGFAFSSEDFLVTVHNGISYDFNGSLIELSSAEGYMFPGVYEISRDAEPHEVVHQFVGRFFSELPSDYFDVSSLNGLNIFEEVTLASMIQKEMVLEEEASLIASVFFNRLKAEMPLQSDPTVQYAVGFSDEFNSWWKIPLEAADLKIDSPFNTYIYTGLPPTPICSPGIEALLGVINPADTDYFYFRMACDGSGRHIFSETYEKHLEAACD